MNSSMTSNYKSYINAVPYLFVPEHFFCLCHALDSAFRPVLSGYKFVSYIFVCVCVCGHQLPYISYIYIEH